MRLKNSGFFDLLVVVVLLPITRATSMSARRPRRRSVPLRFRDDNQSTFFQPKVPPPHPSTNPIDASVYSDKFQPRIRPLPPPAPCSNIMP